MCGLEGELKSWSIAALSLVAWYNKAYGENDAFVLYPTAWFAVTFNLSLDSAECLIKKKKKVLLVDKSVMPELCHSYNM